MLNRLFLSAAHWVQVGNTHATGQAHDASGKLLRAAEIAGAFASLASHDAWGATAAGLNGRFAVVKLDETHAFAAVDRLRSVPVFYAHVEQGFVIADRADSIRPLLHSSTLDPAAVIEFRLAGYVTGDQTLVAGLHQLRAGHVLAQQSGDPAEGRQYAYYQFRHGNFSAGDDETLTRRLVDVHERVFRRLIEDVGDRPLAVPLSGGYDSRLIGVMLRDIGFRNVLCYTYGVPGNWEAGISHELASHLGFRWTMIPYSASTWREWATTPEFKRYFREAGNLSSTPHIQDWPAIFELRKRGDLPDDAVIVPGHSGDFIAGSHIPKWYRDRSRLERRQVLQSLFNAHYSLWDWPSDPDAALWRTISERVERITGPIGDCSAEEAADAFECWDCQERQAKFIVNSVRVYDSFGLAWRLPLFDSELMDFWSRIPLESRVGRRLYFEFVDRCQRLPITPANTDHSAAVVAAIRWMDRLGLRPLVKRGRRVWRRVNWQEQYQGGDMAWFSLVDSKDFHARYTGREIGHSFFALKYLDTVAL
jgi:asparagine synthase (glutamine-hydrolysing)